MLSFIAFNTAMSQSGSQRLKKEQDALKKQIENTKVLLEKSKKSTDLSLEEVKLIERQVEFREKLIRNIDNQIRGSELKITEKEARIQELNAEITKLKKQYAELLLYAYKKRDKFGDLMYIFSAGSIEEAVKRKIYLEKFQEIQKKQLRLIAQNQELLRKEITELEAEKKELLNLSADKKKERAEIVESKKEKELIYQKFKEQKDKLLQELQEKERKNARLEQEIAAAIQKEIAAERARIEKERKEAEARRKAEEARRKAEEAKNSKDKTDPAGSEKPVVTPTFPLIAENELAGKDFASNKGKLPWPVKSGTITSNYGKNPHPTLENVTTQNNGIDISTSKNANVLAVFKGEVTSVITIPGAGKVVIIKHGNYRTVYSNLQEVYVTKGSKVDTRTPIGSLLPTGAISVSHFEIHQVTENSVIQLNPSLWLGR
ncbi:MAG: peptidoglycan DD-metalloendopeptidase family protein [Brumimicrobium sp.]|nr:peptidoglycan DD-metalloendopeptidase family protein [Brumimicrobium sp.]MCO5267432.1 peptidoglycan DD-metalloendopeptidase family protein [Brumimicrobium sp.]